MNRAGIGDFYVSQISGSHWLLHSSSDVSILKLKQGVSTLTFTVIASSKPVC